MEESSVSSSNVDVSQNQSSIFPKAPNVSFSLAKKKFSSNDISIYDGAIGVVTNLFNIKLNQNETKNVYLFGIYAKELFPKTNEDFPLDLMKQVKSTKSFRDKLGQYFHWFYISGLVLFGKPKEACHFEKKPLKVYTVTKPKKEEKEIVVLDEAPNEGRDFIEGTPNVFYSFEITQKKTISEYIQQSEDREFNQVYRSFINIIMGKLLQRAGYEKDKTTRKILYYNPNFTDQNTFEVVRERDFQFSLLAHEAVKAVSDNYEGGKTYFKILPKNILFNEKTYYDYYRLLLKKYPKRRIEKIQEDFVDAVLRQKRGIKRYNGKSEKIEDVVFKNPFEIEFERGGEKISVGEYIQKMYQIKLDNEVQPIAVRYIDKGGKIPRDECQKLYIPMECLMIVGNISGIKINVSKLVDNPRNKYQKILGFREKIVNEYQKEKDSKSSIGMMGSINFSLESLSVGGKVLARPKIIFENGNKEVRENGSFDVENTQPYKKDNKLENFEVFYLDTTEQMNCTLMNMLYDASLSMGITISKSFNFTRIEYYDNMKVFEENLIEIFDSRAEKGKEDKSKAIEFIFIFLRKEDKGIYKYIKNALNNSKLQVPSQVMIYDDYKLERKRSKSDLLSMGTNILTQIWAKKGSTLFASDFSFVKDTVVMAYSVMKYGNNSIVTSICASYTKEKTDYVFFSDICEASDERMATNVRKLVKDSIMSIWKYIKCSVKNIVIYREGVNEKQIKLLRENEIPELLGGIQDALKKIKENKDEKYKKQREFFADPKVLFIMVNKISEIKMFYNQELEGINVDSLKNPPVGSVFDSDVTTQEYFDFYINSAFTPSGTCTPTHYFVLVDETNLSADTIFKLTYNLTYMSYNTTKSIKVPAPLYFVSRRNKFTRENLDKIISKTLKIYNVSL